MQIDSFLGPCTKLNSKCLEDLIIRTETLNQTEEELGSIFRHTGIGNNFMIRTPIIYALRTTINKQEPMRLRTFSKKKDAIIQTRQYPRERKMTFTNSTTNRGLITKIYKELQKHGIKKKPYFGMRHR